MLVHPVAGRSSGTSSLGDDVFVGRGDGGFGTAVTRTVNVVHGNTRPALAVIIIIIIVVVVVIVADTAANGADEPRGAAGSLPGPVLLEVVLAGLELAAGEEDDDGDEAVEDCVDKDAAEGSVSWEREERQKGASLRDEAVGDAVAEGDKGHDDKGGEDVADVSPVNLGDLTDHHAADLRSVSCRHRPRGVGTYQDEGTASGPWRDRRKDGSKKHRDDEAKPGDHGRQPSSPTLRDAGAALDKGRDGGAPKQGADGDEGGIGAVGDGGAGKVAVAVPHDAAETDHGVESRSGVDDVDVEEGEEGEGELRGGGFKGPVELVERLFHGMEDDDLLEKVEAGVALGGVREVGDGGVAAYWRLECVRGE